MCFDNEMKNVGTSFSNRLRDKFKSVFEILIASSDRSEFRKMSGIETIESFMFLRAIDRERILTLPTSAFLITNNHLSDRILFKTQPY